MNKNINIIICVALFEDEISYVYDLFSKNNLFIMRENNRNIILNTILSNIINNTFEYITIYCIANIINKNEAIFSNDENEYCIEDLINTLRETCVNVNKYYPTVKQNAIYINYVEKHRIVKDEEEDELILDRKVIINNKSNNNNHNNIEKIIPYIKI